MSAKNWCFTINNPTDESIQRTTESLQRSHEDGDVLYAVFQLEAGAQGTPHLQGYVQLGRKCRMQTVKRFLSSEAAHLEIARGNPQQNEEYCSKDPRLRDTVRIGQLQPGAGHRSDLDAITQQIAAGTLTRELIRANPSLYVRNFRGLHQLDSVLNPPPDRPENVIVWLYGRSGCGKSRLARALGGPDAYYRPLANWWDGYLGDRTVVLDDFEADQIPFKELLRVTDRYPHRVPIKGGYTALRGVRFVFTSLYEPRVVFVAKSDFEYEQIGRRITAIVNIEAGETYAWPEDA